MTKDQLARSLLVLYALTLVAHPWSKSCLLLLKSGVDGPPCFCHFRDRSGKERVVWD